MAGPAAATALRSRTILELIASLMQAGFEVAGEGVLLATMPPVLERFGARNAQYIARKFVSCDAAAGVAGALAPVNYLSRVTDTPFQMLETSASHAVKRLQSCEFADAFASKDPFARALICQLHRAVYQGSVNGLVREPARDGYDVSLRSRILFGDAHCDFVVDARASPSGPGPGDGTERRAITPAELEDQSHQFYMAILLALVDHLDSILSPEQLAAVVDRCGRDVGAKVARLLQPEGSPQQRVEFLLTLGGRTMRGLEAHACPYASAIAAAARGRPPADAHRLREGACGLCTSFLSGAVGQAGAPPAHVARDGALAHGDAACRFRVEGA